MMCRDLSEVIHSQRCISLNYINHEQGDNFLFRSQQVEDGKVQLRISDGSSKSDIWLEDDALGTSSFCLCSGCPDSDQLNCSGKKREVLHTPYLGRQHPHPADCHPLWCESPWWHQLHPAAPRHCWHWWCCCSCFCSILCGRAAPTPFSKAPLPWTIRREGGREEELRHTDCAMRGLDQHFWGECFRNRKKGWVWWHAHWR